MGNDKSFKTEVTEKSPKSSSRNSGVIWIVLVFLVIVVFFTFHTKAKKEEKIRKQENVEYLRKLKIETLRVIALKYQDTIITHTLKKSERMRFNFGTERGPRMTYYISQNDHVLFEVINPDGQSIFSDPKLNPQQSKTVKFLRAEHEYVDIIAHSQGDKFSVKLKKR
ncbi:MAG: ATP-dependent Zn protease [Crocinitomicaceae bacterium]|jgi:ATP-dependent Zn protease